LKKIWNFATDVSSLLLFTTLWVQATYLSALKPEPYISHLRDYPSPFSLSLFSVSSFEHRTYWMRGHSSQVVWKKGNLRLRSTFAIHSKFFLSSSDFLPFSFLQLFIVFIRFLFVETFQTYHHLIIYQFSLSFFLFSSLLISSFLSLSLSLSLSICLISSIAIYVSIYRLMCLSLSLSLALSQSICLISYTAIYVSIYILIYLPVLSIYLHVCLFLYTLLSISASRLFIYLSACLSIYLSIYPFIYLSVYLSVNQFTCLSVYRSILFFPCLYLGLFSSSLSTFCYFRNVFVSQQKIFSLITLQFTTQLIYISYLFLFFQVFSNSFFSAINFILSSLSLNF